MLDLAVPKSDFYSRKHILTLGNCEIAALKPFANELFFPHFSLFFFYVESIL